MNIYVVRNGQTYGPYTDDVVRKYISEGSILSTDMGRTDTMPTLVPLSQLLAKEAPSQPPYQPPVQPPYQAPQPQPTPQAQVPESKPDYGFASAAASAASVFGSGSAAAGPGTSVSKKQYLESIRADSAYPTYRGFIGIIALIGFVIAGVVALGAVGAGLASMRQSAIGGLALIVGGLLYAALLFLMARFFKEAALILADIGDSTVDANSRHRAGH